jgi:26 proteasome complex subunit DSS1
LLFWHYLSDWTGTDEDEEDISVWEDNWDDDNVEDDFSMQLRFAVLC